MRVCVSVRAMCAHVCMCTCVYVCAQTVAHAFSPCVLKESQFRMPAELLPSDFFMIFFLGR